MLALHPPVDAPIVRPFAYAGSPFARGLHRGVDLAAPPGAPVLAPCAGTVAYAGAHVLTLRCGRFRVTLLPLRGVRARAGSPVVPGERVGGVGTGGGHAGLHLGVRRAADRFGYVDPALLLARAPSAPLGPAPPPAAPRARRRPPARPAPPAAASGPAPVAAWAAFAAAALAASGSVRLGIRRRRHKRRETIATA